MKIETPELDKMLEAAKHGHSQLLGEFLEWMRAVDHLLHNGLSWDWEDRKNGKISRDDVFNSVVNLHDGIVLDRPEAVGESAELAVKTFTIWYDGVKEDKQHRPVSQVLEDYFDIDGAKIEKERRAILEECRTANATD